MKGTGQRWARLSLRGKLMAGVLVPAVFFSSVFYYFSLQGMAANFEREYKEKAMAIAQTLQQSVTSEDLGDAQRLTGLLRGLEASNPNVSGLAVYVLRGDEVVVVASSDADRIGQTAKQHDLDSIRKGQPHLLEHVDLEPHLIEANVPLLVRGVPVASMGVYMSLEARDALLRSYTTSLLLIGGSGVILMLGLVYLLSERLIVGPVARISRAASRIASGYLDTKVPELGQDEVGTLASSVSAMVAELMEDRRTLERLATTDGLTGLWNHRFFHERLLEEMNRAVRLREPLSLIMLDLDRFKAFNDTYGHVKGDELLRASGQILRSSVRPYDVPCRYGGEEFAVIVPGADAVVAREVAERVRRRIAEANFTGMDGQPAPLTASFGISSYPADESSPDGLVRLADSALYAAKRSGGNAVRIYEPHQGAHAVAAPLSLEKLVKEASLGVLQALARAVDARETASRSHSASVTGYARSLGVALGLAGEELETLEAAALLHDVGKIGLPDAILSKPGSLTDLERDTVRVHPVIGAQMVERVPHFTRISTAVRYHHERWDGAGYPDGLNGEDIPLFARLLAVADAYEAMTATRSFRGARSSDEALEELKRGAGSQFDPALVGIFIDLIRKEDPSAAEEYGRSSVVLGGGLQSVINVDAGEYQDGGDYGDVEGAHNPP